MRSWDEIMHDPRIDDSGDYDYLAEELPQNETYWIKKYPCRCDSCGKERRFSRRQVGYFYCWDGYDSMDYTECWKCIAGDKVHATKWKIRRLCRRATKAIHYKKIYDTFTWAASWDLAKSVIK